MILGRNLNQIGYTSRVIGPKTKDVSIFAETVLSLVSENQERGISVTCIEVEQGFQPLNFSSIEDSSQESEVIWEVFQFLKSNRHRLFFFLPSYYFLGSQIPEVVTDTKEVLKSLSIFLDQVGVKETSIILRIGSAYGARKPTMERFCIEIEGLGDSIIEKLSVCNDEKPSLFSVTDLLSGIFYRIGIPIVFRFLPHQFNAGSLSTREAYFLAVSTWVKGKDHLDKFGRNYFIKMAVLLPSETAEKLFDFIMREDRKFVLDIYKTLFPENFEKNPITLGGTIDKDGQKYSIPTG